MELLCKIVCWNNLFKRLEEKNPNNCATHCTAKNPQDLIFFFMSDCAPSCEPKQILWMYANDMQSLME